MLLHLLTALRLQPDAPPPTWRLNVCVAGMPVRAQQWQALFPPHAPPLAFPCVVAQGRDDPFYDWCARLARDYAAPTLVGFDEGHRFPHAKEKNAELAEALWRGVASGSRE